MRLCYVQSGFVRPRPRICRDGNHLISANQVSVLPGPPSQPAILYIHTGRWKLKRPSPSRSVGSTPTSPVPRSHPGSLFHPSVRCRFKSSAILLLYNLFQLVSGPPTPTFGTLYGVPPTPYREGRQTLSFRPAFIFRGDASADHVPLAPWRAVCTIQVT